MAWSKKLQFIAVSATFPPPLVSEAENLFIHVEKKRAKKLGQPPMRDLAKQIFLCTSAIKKGDDGRAISRDPNGVVDDGEFESAVLRGVLHLKYVVPGYHTRQKLPALLEILTTAAYQQAFVFTNDPGSAVQIAEMLSQAGIPAAASSGRMEQAQRTQAFAGLKRCQYRVVVCTDLLARGVDVERVDVVVNLDLPAEKETYLHRSGRTARFGSVGWSVSLVFEGEEEEHLNYFQMQLGFELASYENREEASAMLLTELGAPETVATELPGFTWAPATTGTPPAAVPKARSASGKHPKVQPPAPSRKQMSLSVNGSQMQQRPDKWSEGVPGEWEPTSAADDDDEEEYEEYEVDEEGSEEEAVDFDADGSAHQWPLSGFAEPHAQLPSSVWASSLNTGTSSSIPLSAFGAQMQNPAHGAAHSPQQHSQAQSSCPIPPSGSSLALEAQSQRLQHESRCQQVLQAQQALQAQHALQIQQALQAQALQAQQALQEQQALQAQCTPAQALLARFPPPPIFLEPLDAAGIVSPQVRAMLSEWQPWMLRCGSFAEYGGCCPGAAPGVLPGLPTAMGLGGGFCAAPLPGLSNGAHPFLQQQRAHDRLEALWAAHRSIWTAAN